MVRIVSIITLLLHGIVAAICGYAMMKDPSGVSMGLDIKLLYASDFVNFFVPGLILFSVLGVGSIAAAFAAISRIRNYPVIILLSGLITIGWIIGQVLILQVLFFMQYVIAAVGLVILICGLILLNKTAKE